MGVFLSVLIVAFFFLGFLAKQVNISSYKSHDKRRQDIAKKYGGTGYPTVHLMKHQTTPENYAKYQAEVDALDRQYGYKK